MKYSDKWTFMRILLHLWSTVNGVTLTDLRKEIGMKVTVWHIDWLEKHHYVHRVSDSNDDRRLNIYLTSKAKPVCKALTDLKCALPEDLANELFRAH
jgi:DNA-binding MarR family transcriptional regulator